MSTQALTKLENLKQIVVQSGPTFNQLARIHGAVHFEREASFAMQLLQENSYLAETAFGNPDSLRRAVINVAAIGLTLSPVYKFAHLVPRDGKVCLDIGFQGFVKLGTDIGSVEWATAEIVKEKDTFLYKGVDEKPLHEFEAFKDRGAVVGGYCLTKLPTGYMTVLMPIDEIYAIRNRTVGWKAHIKDGKRSIWATDETEMIKKTLIRRAWKSWPKTDKSDRLAEAVKVLDESEEITLDAPALPGNNELRTKELASIHEGLAYLKKEESKFAEYCARVNKRDIKDLSEMTDNEISRAAAYVAQLVEKQHELDNAAS